MRNQNRNEELDGLEQDVVLGLHNSYERFKKTWEKEITFNDYLTSLRIGIEHPELVEILRDDNNKWWDNGGKCNDVYDIMHKGVE